MTHRSKSGRKRMLMAISIMIILLIAATMTVDLLIRSAMNSDGNKEVAYVVILGAGLRDDQPSLSLRYRLQAAIEYMQKHPESIVIASGGLGLGERYMEAEVMKDFLMAAGIAADRIIKEEKATNTLENLRYTREIILERETNEGRLEQEQEKIELMIVTSDFHLYRAKMIAKRLGFEPYGMPAKTPKSVAIKLRIREYVAVMKSYMFDR